MLRDRLARHRHAAAQARRRAGAVGQQQIEQAAPGRVADGRPELVVDGRVHDRTRPAAYAARVARCSSHPMAVVAVGAPRAGRPPSRPRGNRPRSGATSYRRGAGASSNVTRNEFCGVAGFDPRAASPAEDEPPRSVGLDDDDRRRPSTRSRRRRVSVIWPSPPVAAANDASKPHQCAMCSGLVMTS